MNDEFLKTIESLPETLVSSRLHDYFLEAINLYEQQLIDRNAFITLIDKLADKQWHNYEKLNSNTLNILDRIFSAIITSVNEINNNTLEVISKIIGTLGLSETYKMYKLALIEGKLTNEKRIEINNTINEYGDSVENPWK